MTRLPKWPLLLLGLWLCSGFYLIAANQQGVVRRFGRAQPAVVPSGLHFDLPWPCVRVDRVNVQELRTLTVGVAAVDSLDPSGFLRPSGLDRVGEFLTGDKNLLNLQVNLQYRVADPLPWLTGHEAPEVRLRLLAESRIAEVVGLCGVDYVHPLGLDELRQWLSRDLAREVAAAGLGVELEEATIAAVWPPIEVKAAFLDVSNARAERDKLIEQQRSLAEQQVTATRAKARQQLDQAQGERQRQIELAAGSADRFRALLAALDKQAASGNTSRDTIRARAMQRLFLESLTTLWPRLGRTLVVETDQPLDLRLFPAATPPRSEGAEPAARQ
ncbi:MAG: protease modulator HflK [Planctomycetaceae bacterium]